MGGDQINVVVGRAGTDHDELIPTPATDLITLPHRTAQPSRNGGVALGPIPGPVALGRDLLPDRLDNPSSAVLFDELGVGRLVDERAYGRQGARPVNPGIRYPMHSPTEIRLAGSKNGSMA